MQGGYEPVRTHDDWSLRQNVIVLLDPLQIFPGRISLSDGSGSEIHDLVSIPSDVCVQLSNTEMSPISTDHREDVAQTIRPAPELVPDTKVKRITERE
jgi:hypothetical protein